MRKISLVGSCLTEDCSCSCRLLLQRDPQKSGGAKMGEDCNADEGKRRPVAGDFPPGTSAVIHIETDNVFAVRPKKHADAFPGEDLKDHKCGETECDDLKSGGGPKARRRERAASHRCERRMQALHRILRCESCPQIVRRRETCGIGVGVADRLQRFQSAFRSRSRDDFRKMAAQLAHRRIARMLMSRRSGSL